MGYHQLIIITLSSIVAAVGVTMGITMFEEDSKQFQEDAATVAMLDVAGRAVEWSNRPQAMGGGMDAYGASTFNGITMKKLGYDHPTEENGALSLPDGSCITGKPAAAGKAFHIEWHPTGDCSGVEKVALRLEVTGPTLDHITMVEGAYASVWRDG